MAPLAYPIVLTQTSQTPMHVVDSIFVGRCIWLLFAAFLRGVGDTRTALVAARVANATHAILAHGLLLGRLGLPGARSRLGAPERTRFNADDDGEGHAAVKGDRSL